MNDAPKADRFEADQGSDDRRRLSADYLDESGLRSLGLEKATIERLLRDTPLRGNGGRPVIEAHRVNELLAMLRWEDER
jgi:hypothetical protein